ncbi:MAG: endonuclease/exonuclease/phosphatase family protein [Candidatus Caenarcaniphilales bacterium]|nr:endonuclease/exonuclease/phosphatase family protein [Candidatus Caenarcaniphilales bacterium]
MSRLSRSNRAHLFLILFIFSFQSSFARADDSLASLERFKASDLNEYRKSQHFPSTYIELSKLQTLFKHYDLAQPSRKFDPNPFFRVASFNITRGYSLEQLKEIFKVNPAFTSLLQKFPEIEDITDADEAVTAVTRAGKDNAQLGYKRAEDFYRAVEDLLDLEKSNFPLIICSRVIDHKVSCLGDHKALNGDRRIDFLKTVFELAREIYDLSIADAVALQEVDWGMPRTEYLHIVKELAKSTGHGYAYGLEFIEVLDEGIPYDLLKEPIDEERFRGFHGNAILSRWHLKNIRLIQTRASLQVDPTGETSRKDRCYDWWREELPKVGPFEKLIKTGSEIVFDEKVIPSLRIGGRMAVVADVHSPHGVVTVVSTHLENRGNAKCRRAQLEEIFTSLKSLSGHPVVVAGDMNTTNEEARRPYLRYVAYWFIKNQLEIPTLVANILTTTGSFFVGFPIPAVPALVNFVDQIRKWRNPPGLLSEERKFFRNVVQRFEFDDGTVFDTRGSYENNHQGSHRLLANSNQATPIGYKPTYCFERNYKHIFCMKLDWIFVKTNITRYHRHHCELFDDTWSPYNPRTLYALSAIGEISEHGAITTDLKVPQPKALADLSK